MRSLLNYRNYGRLWRVYVRSGLRYLTITKLINALRTEYAYRRRISDVRSYPYILFVEPLYYCNLDCPLCDRQVFPDARKEKGAAGKLSLELFDKLIDEAGKYLFQCQLFGQGEPLLDWPRSRAIIQRCHRRKIFTLLSTNCTLITEAMADDIVTSGLDHLVCAIDGVSQSAYEQYRVGGSVEQAMLGMKRVLDARRRRRSGIEVEWQFLIHKGNAHEVEAARKLAADLGVYLRPSPLRGMEFDPELREQWLPDEAAMENPRIARLSRGEPFYDWPCYFLWRSLVLNSNGKAARCLIYQNVAEYGSLADMSFHDLYNHLSIRRARQLFARGPVPDGPFPAPCNNCSYFGRTHGGPNLNKHESLQRVAELAAEAGFGASFVPIDQLAIRPRRNSRLPEEDPQPHRVEVQVAPHVKTDATERARTL